mgnify:CR=1 FL=1
MALRTRLDSRSDGNNRLAIVDADGAVIAIIKAVSDKVEVDITTATGLHIEKPNGFSSKR